MVRVLKKGRKKGRKEKEREGERCGTRDKKKEYNSITMNMYGISHFKNTFMNRISFTSHL